MSTQAGGVRFEQDGSIGHILLDRPKAANAVDLPAARAFGEAVTAAASPGVAAVTLTGAGKRFCAGGDVASFVAATDRADYLHTLATELEGHLRRLSQLPKPVVAGVHGAVAGAGLAFVLNADVVIAARSTKFVFAYPGIGLTPDCGVSWLLPRAVGQQRALEFALTGRVLSADEAQAWGLVSEVVEDEQAHTRTSEVAAQLAAGPTVALGETKRLLRSSWDASRSDNAADEAATMARMVTTENAERLIGEFVGR